MKSIIRGFLVLGLILLSQKSMALLELRASGGIQLVSPDDLNTNLKNKGWNELSLLPRYGAEAIVNLPAVPFGFGLKYEITGGSASGTASGTAFDAELSASQLALIVNKRFIDTVLHFGVIGSFGISHSSTVKLVGPPAVNFDGEANSVTSWSVGAEALFTLGTLLVGAEGGYQHQKLKDVRNASNSTFENISDYDLSGLYLKALVGFSF